MKVLQVEDNEYMQRMYGRAFEQAGITLVSQSDGSKAVETALAEMPDIILMDVMMPQMNGLDALTLLKQNEQVKHIPVIMLSAHEDDELLIKSMQLGANRYLVKSNLEPDQVISIVKEVLSGNTSQAA